MTPTELGRIGLDTGGVLGGGPSGVPGLAGGEHDGDLGGVPGGVHGPQGGVMGQKGGVTGTRSIGSSTSRSPSRF